MPRSQNFPTIPIFWIRFSPKFTYHILLLPDTGTVTFRQPKDVRTCACTSTATTLVYSASPASTHPTLVTITILPDRQHSHQPRLPQLKVTSHRLPIILLNLHPNALAVVHPLLHHLMARLYLMPRHFTRQLIP